MIGTTSCIFEVLCTGYLIIIANIQSVKQSRSSIPLRNTTLSYLLDHRLLIFYGYPDLDCNAGVNFCSSSTQVGEKNPSSVRTVNTVSEFTSLLKYICITVLSMLIFILIWVMDLRNFVQYFGQPRLF